MATFQVTIDSTDPDRLSRFWAEALGYVIPDPPEGHATWDDWYRSLGVSEDELGLGNDRLADPSGAGPAFWFQQVPEPKTVKNRVHIDIQASGGRAVPMAERRRRIDAEAERLVGLGGTVFFVHDGGDIDHYAVTMHDPEGNEFCLN